MSVETTIEGAALSRGMGAFGIALGVAELAAPRTLARTIGIKPDGRSTWLLRAMGVREVLGGLAVLMRPNRPKPMWARVVGDVIDALFLGTAALTRRRSGARVAGALAAVAGAGALDVIASRRVQRASDEANKPVVFAVTIARPPQEVYAFFRRFAVLPMFMKYIDSVVETGPRTSHWTAKLPVGTVEWDAEIIEDRPGQAIAWRSIDGAPIEMRGRVVFARAPGRESTEVHVELHPGIARLFAKPELKGDLRRLKQVLETGEVMS